MEVNGIFRNRQNNGDPPDEVSPLPPSTSESLSLTFTETASQAPSPCRLLNLVSAERLSRASSCNLSPLHRR